MTEYDPKHDAPNENKPWFSNSTYDALKRAVTVVLPAVGTLYFALAVIWGLPRAEDVVGSIAAVNVFLGVVLALSNSSYKKSDAPFDGALEITNVEGGKKVALALDDLPNALENKDQVTFRVKNL